QHYAMSDHFYQSTFGESTPQHMNLISGNIHGAICVEVNLDTGKETGKKLDNCSVEKDTGNGKKRTIPAVADGTMISNVDPEYDICSGVKPAASTSTAATSTAIGNAIAPKIGYKIEMTGKNLGDLLTKNHISWGWFSAGFKLPTTEPCKDREEHSGLKDYYPDVEPFQYYAQTSNKDHKLPTAKIGDTDQANHQYGLSDFWKSVNAGYMPDVSFIKAPTYQDGHPGISDPKAEQTFLVNTINDIEKSQHWPNTAIILTWDDSGGFYDHPMPPIISKSNDPKNDELYGPTTLCNPSPAEKITQNDKCGYGPRIPMLIISPYAKENFVEYNKSTDFTSILKFIEDNWNLGRIGGGSLDNKAQSLDNMFDFKSPNVTPIILNSSTGEKN
ncbi:MAG: phospholipase C, partial [Candidatus Nitrosocosmicus sp.]